ncbi:DUF6463 family protein [Nonomuraea sp. NPDC059194]|uniref:DUF6463 family protein n=1 Tax=Nonomuraea sp. NPDC059194 TaxID=3346764 RepID=UPI0036C34281
MNGLNRWIPRLIIATAVLHFVWAFAQPNAWAAIVADGFLATVVDTGLPDFWIRESSVWFMASGIALLALGTLTRQILRATGRVPAQIGWYLLALGVPMCALYFPVTGSWALVVIGVLVLAAARRTEGAAVTAEAR